jgi:ParB-like chromosome segregation protein Spo0J
MKVELKESIEKNGLIVPLIVRKSKGPSKRSVGRYIVMDGLKRLRACKALNLTPVPCRVLDTSMDIVHIPLNKISERRNGNK